MDDNSGLISLGSAEAVSPAKQLFGLIRAGQSPSRLVSVSASSWQTFPAPVVSEAMPHQIFRHSHRVTYAECTVGNHIYYARYLDLLEAARGEFFRSLEIPLLALQTEGTLYPVIEARLRYRAPARYDDVLTIEVWLTELSRVKLEFTHRILGPTGNLLVEGTTVHVATGLDEKPKRMASELLEKLAGYHKMTKS